MHSSFENELVCSFTFLGIVCSCVFAIESQLNMYSLISFLIQKKQLHEY